MAITALKVTNLIEALKNYFEAKGNKATDLTETFNNDDKYPSAKATKTYVSSAISNKADKSEIPTVPTKVSDLTNDAGYLTSHQDISGKANTADLATVATSGDYDDLTNKPDLSNLGGLVSVTKLTGSNITQGYLSTYEIKQGSTSLGRIDIPKDFLVKSATLETATSSNVSSLGANFSVGDKYIDFVINTKNNDDTASHIYLKVTDLVDTYEADNVTLQLSNGVFSVKEIGTSQLASSIVTSLGYADTFHNSPAASITSTDVSNWNANNASQTYVDNEIDNLLDALTAGFSNN